MVETVILCDSRRGKAGYYGLESFFLSPVRDHSGTEWDRWEDAEWFAGLPPSSLLAFFLFLLFFCPCAWRKYPFIKVSECMLCGYFARSREGENTLSDRSWLESNKDPICASDREAGRIFFPSFCCGHLLDKTLSSFTHVKVIRLYHTLVEISLHLQQSLVVFSTCRCGSVEQPCSGWRVLSPAGSMRSDTNCGISSVNVEGKRNSTSSLS